MEEVLTTSAAGRPVRCSQLGDVLVDEARMHPAGDEFRASQDVLQEGDVGGDALNAELAERPPDACGGRGEIFGRRPSDDLGMAG